MLDKPEPNIGQNKWVRKVPIPWESNDGAYPRWLTARLDYTIMYTSSEVRTECKKD